MSLLSIAQNVANEIGIPSPVSVIGSTDATAVRLLRVISRATEQLAKKGRWQNFFTSYTFNTVSGTDLYGVPSDLSYIVPSTLWDNTNHWPLNGPLSEQEWQAYKSSLVAIPTVQSRLRLYQGQLQIDPVPSAVVTIAFIYCSNGYMLSSGGVRQTGFQADTDTTVLPEWLVEMGAIWRYKRTRGLPYADERADFERLADIEYAKNKAKPTLDVGRRDVRRVINVPEGNFPAPL